MLRSYSANLSEKLTAIEDYVTERFQCRHKNLLAFIIVFFDLVILLCAFTFFSIHYYQAAKFTSEGVPLSDYALPPEQWLIPNDVVFAMAFFPLGRSKHSLAEYTQWTENLFSVLQCRVVLFTVPTSVSFYSRIYLKYKYKFPERSITHIRNKTDLQNYKGSVETTMVIVSMYHNVYDLPPIQPYLEEIKTKQHALDPSSINSEPLYAVWSSKVWFLHESMSFFKRPGLLYFWFDVGNKRYKQRGIHFWPNMRRLSELVGGRGLTRLEDKFINVMVYRPRFTRKLQKEKGDIVFSYGFTRNDVTVAFFFGGSRKSIEFYYKKYYEKIAEWSSQNMFWGVEQIVMDAVAFHNHEKILVIENADIHSDEWQYKYYSFVYSYLASSFEKSPARFTSDPLKPFTAFISEGE